MFDVNGQPDNVLLDCRPTEQADIIRFKEFKVVPWVDFCEYSKEEIEDILPNDPNKKIYIMCRRGNQSRLMCDFLHTFGYKSIQCI